MQLRLECVCVWALCVRLQYGTFLKPRGRVGLDAQIKQCVFACKCVCGVVGQCRKVLGFRVKGLVSVTVIEATVYKQRVCQCVCRFDLSTVQNSEHPFWILNLSDPSSSVSPRPPSLCAVPTPVHVVGCLGDAMNSKKINYAHSPGSTAISENNSVLGRLHTF